MFDDIEKKVVGDRKVSGILTRANLIALAKFGRDEIKRQNIDWEDFLPSDDDFECILVAELAEGPTETWTFYEKEKKNEDRSPSQGADPSIPQG